MKLGPITIGGRRDGSGYQHSTATIVITPEDGDTIDECMQRATTVLDEAFQASEVAVDKRPLRTPSLSPPPPAPKAPSVPLQSFPATEVGKLAKTIVSNAAPTAKTPEAPKSAPAAPAGNDEEGLKRRVYAWHKILTKMELSEGDFLRACGVKTPEELKQLNQPLTWNQLKVFVDDVAKILKNSDNVPM